MPVVSLTNIEKTFGRRTLFAAVAVLVSASAFSRCADASCGDWLAGHANASDHVGLATSATSADEALPMLPASGQSCQGEGCRRAPAPAPLPAAPAPSWQNGSDHNCILDGRPFIEPARLSRWGGDEAVSVAAGFPLRIERPPRG